MGRIAQGLTVAATLVLAGCGSESKASDAAKRFSCLLRAENHARYDVVSDYYERGRLGSAAQVRREALALKSPGLITRSFIDGDGDLVPYDRMSDSQRDTFLTWEKTRRVQSIVGPEERDAVERARAEAADRCD